MAITGLQVLVDTGRYGEGPFTWVENYEKDDRTVVMTATRAGGFKLRMTAAMNGDYYFRLAHYPPGIFSSITPELVIKGKAGVVGRKPQGDELLGIGIVNLFDIGSKFLDADVVPDIPFKANAACRAEREKQQAAQEAERQREREARRQAEAREEAALAKARRVRGSTYIKAALTEFGTTENPLLAGYILPDGQMLDFSYGQRMRTADHREIGAAHPALPGGTDGMRLFQLRTGAIRIGGTGALKDWLGKRAPPMLWFDLVKAPTPEQERRVARAVQQVEPGHVEIINYQQGRVTLEWPRPADVVGRLWPSRGRANTFRPPPAQRAPVSRQLIERFPRAPFGPVVALYVDPLRGPYPRLLGRENCWGLPRDAREYAGPFPIVAHPPCGPWGALRKFCTKQDPEVAIRAVEQLRAYGGVLEHPANSLLWKQLGLPRPGEGVDPRTGLWTLAVRQCDWGHKAEKKTWLLFAGVLPDEIPPMPPCQGYTHVVRGTTGKAEPGRHLRKSGRHLTPDDFARWLIECALRVKPKRLRP